MVLQWVWSCWLLNSIAGWLRPSMLGNIWLVKLGQIICSLKTPNPSVLRGKPNTHSCHDRIIHGHFCHLFNFSLKILGRSDQVKYRMLWLLVGQLNAPLMIITIKLSWFSYSVIQMINFFVCFLTFQWVDIWTLSIPCILTLNGFYQLPGKSHEKRDAQCLH